MYTTWRLKFILCVEIRGKRTLHTEIFSRRALYIKREKVQEHLQMKALYIERKSQYPFWDISFVHREKKSED